ncbi:1-aminocyclopropane-1-carboxylate deaminase/D-cysteine desulfhydrase [Chitinophagaceae bacterium MMS25-I14]
MPDLFPIEKIPVQPLHSNWWYEGRTQVFMLRLDMTDPVISGNKWFKLKYNLQEARDKGIDTILTFGGPFSNHLIATAAAAHKYGLKSVGIVRGMEEQLTPTLKECTSYGMKLHGVNRETYSRKEEPAFLLELQQHFPDAFIIPEGGANDAGRKGVAEIARFIEPQFTHICVSVGSGTTLAGLREALPVTQQIIGFAPMKGGKYLEAEIAAQLSPEQNKNWRLTDEFHFGGFGRINTTLTEFMSNFEAQLSIPLDRVYTSKMMYGVQQLLHRGDFGDDAQVLCIHTGGLQGNRGLVM